MTATVEADTRVPARGRPWRRVLSVLLPLAVIALVFGWLLPKVVDYRIVLRELTTLKPWVVVGLLILATVRLLPGAWLDSTVVPGLRFFAALRAWLCAQTTLLIAPSPADVVMRFAVYRSSGVPVEKAAVGMAIAGLSGYVARLGVPVLVAIGFTATGTDNETLKTVAWIGAIVLIVVTAIGYGVFATDAVGRFLGRVLSAVFSPIARLFRRKPPDFAARIVDGVHAGRAVLRGRWPIVVAALLAVGAAEFALFDACFRAVGVGQSALGWSDLLLGYAAMAVMAAIPLTPAGLGLVEPTVIALLTGLSPAGTGAADQIAAAVLLYRMLALVFPMVLGILPLAAWLRSRAAAAKI